jgi:hypothetical protein
VVLVLTIITRQRLFKKLVFSTTLQLALGNAWPSSLGFSTCFTLGRPSTRRRPQCYSSERQSPSNTRMYVPILFSLPCNDQLMSCNSALRQMVYLAIKELATTAEDIIMVTSSILKDMRPNPRSFAGQM